MVMTQEFKNLIATYENTVEWHKFAYEDFELKARATPWLWDHREWCVRNFWGFGDHAHWHLWKLLVDQMPNGFKFLEIGVYRGAILSLIPLIARHQGKECYTYGVTPLEPTSDEQATYTDSPNGYEADVAYACRMWGNGSQPQIIRGMSYDPKIVADTKIYRPFDVVYIDGGHFYECVAMDLFNYAPLVGQDGFLVLDDASWFLDFEPQIWRGYESVGRAIEDCLPKTIQGGTVYSGPFCELFAIGHHRVFQKKVS